MTSETGPRRLRTPESVGYALKRLLLGKPLINDQLKHERLSNPLRWACCPRTPSRRRLRHRGDPDRAAAAASGLAAFTLLLPMTGVILFVLVLVAAVLPRGRHGLHQAGRLVRGGAGELRARGSPRSPRWRC